MGAVVRGVVSIDIRRLPEALRRNEEALREAIARGVSAGLARGRAIMVKATPTDQGQLRASWHVRRRVEGAAGLNRNAEATVAELHNDAPYAGIVELGARPHGLSPSGWAMLYEWVRRHPELWGATTITAGRKTSWRPRATLVTGDYRGPNPLITLITNAIAAKLRREGQKPTYFVRNNLYRVGDAVASEIRREVDLLVEKAGGYARG